MFKHNSSFSIKKSMVERNCLENNKKIRNWVRFSQNRIDNKGKRKKEQPKMNVYLSVIL